MLARRSDADGQQVQIALGADDNHLRFRSSAALRRVGTHEIALTMATRVSCRNIHHAHHHDVMPTMLRAAVGRALHAEPLTSQAWPAQPA
ncbi:hypothetical protein BI315_04990 [Xanthomonas citri pv. citri]|uniref:Uncharacterized protein n=2 Tax=Xanthomonas citri pv. citri TaxID=611301 RepID=A0AAI7ZGL7_XANAC|nr:conserved hypothetical protein [Xanthomonas citri pv. citri str. 306]AGH78281.1 hypothetical protein XAC29_14235 [Xanthomonas axonopodis Xac29-1]AGI07183.1 Hypothetical Protein XCAW_01381 [Xanthomonas citri subsp. citri Aw12879]AJZ48193.1 Protein of unknown function (DUF2867) [Xanthomonas citri pv. citri]AJZ52811.1 Protein of unknown function (DUF2867) [Xanthomonas citri pv. citri]